MKSDININNKDCLLNWKEFEISRLFTIKSPAARTIKSYSEGKTPYVSSGSFNNGIVSYLEPMADEKIEKGQCITVSPLDGSAFFQEEDFLGRGGAGSAISLLYNLNLTRYNALFICTIIKIMAEKFGYNDALTSDNLRKLRIKLPIEYKEDGSRVYDSEKRYSDEGFVPDWGGMEKCMKELKKKVDKSLDSFQAVSLSKQESMDVSGWREFPIADFFDFSLPKGDLQVKKVEDAVQVVARYCERDSKLKAVVIKAVLTNPQMSANFLSYVYDDVAVEGIINFFENDIIALASIYMSAIENNCHIDYDGKLFKRIFEQHPTVWNEYVDWIKSKDTMCGDGNEHKIIELIWGDDKWRECVEYAFKVLIDDDVIFHIKEPADMLFTNTTDETILERKKYWLIEKLRETSLELKKCKKLIEMVVNVLPDWKLEYILEFLKINKNPEDFKEIPLFPSSYSWSGSEIPLIMEKIDFLKSLKDNIKGINFIEHRKYIEEYRMNLERYKDNVELREYLENADYA